MNQTFWGGIHPSGNKESTRNAPLVRAPIPKVVILPMRQHIGAPCTPTVAVGDQVLYGQKIGDGAGLCVPVHASVSGRVTDIAPYPHPSGQQVLAVVIENDGKDTPAPTLEQVDAPLEATLREAGLSGMGGAAFPTYEKLRSAIGNIDTLLINACECEPWVTADEALLCTDAEAVLQGAALLAQATGASKVVLATESDKQKAIATVQRILEQHPDICLKILPARYPQGSEKQLIQAVTGRQIPPGRLPADVGCLVCNAATAAAAYYAVRKRKPLVERIVTVSGPATRTPKNMLVRLGTPIRAILEETGGMDAPLILAGGPMMGVALTDLDTPITKSVNAILCMASVHTLPERPICIRCGRCVLACPMHLQPLYLYAAGRQEDLSALEQFRIADCMECGCCAYVCPGQLPLVTTLRAGKAKWKEAKA